jgi:hypothetical protein
MPQSHGFDLPIGFLILKPDKPFPFIEVVGKKYLVMMDRGGTTFHERFVADPDNNKTYLHVKLADALPIPSTKLGIFSSHLACQKICKQPLRRIHLFCISQCPLKDMLRTGKRELLIPVEPHLMLIRRTAKWTWRRHLLKRSMSFCEFLGRK